MSSRPPWPWFALPLTLALAGCSAEALGGFLVRSVASSLGLPSVELPSPGPDAQERAWAEASLDLPPPPESPEGRLLKELNRWRAASGLKPAAWRLALAQGAQAHARYLLWNRHRPHQEALGTQAQDPTASGASPEGAAVAAQSDVAFLPPEPALAAFLGSLYHRLPCLSPQLRAVGVGQELMGSEACTVLAFERVPEHQGGPFPVSCPGAQQGEVPLRFLAEALSPSPLPPGAPLPAGFPITLQFGQAGWVVDAAKLLGPEGQELPCWRSDPQAPASSFPQQEALCLLPKAPLVPQASYEVQVEARAPEGLARRFRWRFHTRAASASWTPSLPARPAP